MSCGTALLGHVTSGAIYTVFGQVSGLQSPDWSSGLDWLLIQTFRTLYGAGHIYLLIQTQYCFILIPDSHIPDACGYIIYLAYKVATILTVQRQPLSWSVMLKGRSLLPGGVHAHNSCF